MSRFNLIDEQWIPVQLLNGTRDELGIRETLLRSHEIATIEDTSPLVVTSIYRFLLAVLYRSLQGPTDIDQAKLLFTNSLPLEKITAYLEAWYDRFWLYDDKYPFWQIPTFTPKIWRSWTVLAAEHNADNAKVLFDHVNIENSGTVSNGSAARWLLATQTFSVSCGKSELAHTGTAPSATAAMVLPLGRDLRDTLLFSLVPMNREIIGHDLPVWERNPESVEELRRGVKRNTSGLADLYTWRTRTVRLQDEGENNVGKLAFASGVGNESPEQRDPMLAYRVDPKEGTLPVQFRDRGIWRDFDSLLPDKEHLAPQVIEHATVLSRSNRKRFPHAVMVLGQANNKAKIEFWRMERFVLPQALAGDRFIRAEIRQLLTDAEDSQKYLWQACCSFAEDLLSRGERKPDKKDVRRFVDQMPCIPWYWSALESGFHKILQEYTLDRDPDDIRYLWLKSVHDTLEKAWQQHCTSISMADAWAIRAMVKAEKTVLNKLKKLTAEIEKLAPQKEEP
ncbi:MAG: type I-E CRISPR-associated protein Cse1/CasA [Desulfobulbus sp.]|nr:type I-E CRISPR-associated protein Cse1/CasA [Desulfobulbus sp.]